MRILFMGTPDIAAASLASPAGRRARGLRVFLPAATSRWAASRS